MMRSALAAGAAVFFFIFSLSTCQNLLSTGSTEAGTIEFEVSVDGTAAASGGILDFGLGLVGVQSQPRVLTLKNTGTAALTVKNAGLLSGDLNQFIYTAEAAVTVSPGAEAALGLKFSPSSVGVKSVLFSLFVDEAKATFTYTVKGTAIVAAGLAVLEGSAYVENGGTFEFGDAALPGGTVSKTFSVMNGSPNPIDLTGNPGKAALASEWGFSVVQDAAAASLASGASTTFTLRFAPVSRGAYSTTLTLPNSTADSNPYVFTINGSGKGPALGILQGGEAEYFNEQTYDYGAIGQFSNGNVSFTLRNYGETEIAVSSLSLLNQEVFLLDYGETSFPLTIPAGSTFNFNVNISSGEYPLGLKEDELTVISDDPDVPTLKIHLLVEIVEGSA